jgi:pectate lyase
MPLFAIAHVANNYFEYLIILNARLSSPARSFPIGASSVTLDVEAYSNGIGIVSSFFPKIGDDVRDGANATTHIIDAIETFMVVGVVVNFNQYLVTNKQEAGVVHPGFGEITAKLHSRAAPNTGQILYAKRIPITPLAIWGGSTNINDSQLLSPNYFKIVPG